jgi:FKBP-type peptidyl-prolyl cis-trans isomerase FklB
MKKYLVALLPIALMVGQVCAEEKMVLKTEKDRISYSIGMDIGENFKKQSIEINTEAMVRGIADAVSSSKPLMNEKEIQETMGVFQKKMMAKQGEKMKVDGEKNKKEGEAFLEENKKKEGIKTTASGLQYKVIKDDAKGKKPKATDTVLVNYKGTLLDGTEFDSSYKRGQPASFPVNQVIPGWTEAIQLMSVGSKYQLFIPSQIAYGERGAGGLIGPNATLIFEVELLDIK